jgi:hypothetical protein
VRVAAENWVSSLLSSVDWHSVKMTLVGGPVIERLDKPSSYVEAKARSRVLPSWRRLLILDGEGVP